MNRVKRKIKRVLAMICVFIIAFGSFTAFAASEVAITDPTRIEPNDLQSFNFSNFASDVGFVNSSKYYRCYDTSAYLAWYSARLYNVMLRYSTSGLNGDQGNDYRQQFNTDIPILNKGNKYTLYVKYTLWGIAPDLPKDSSLTFNWFGISDCYDYQDSTLAGRTPKDKYNYDFFESSTIPLKEHDGYIYVDFALPSSPYTKFYVDIFDFSINSSFTKNTSRASGINYCLTIHDIGFATQLSTLSSIGHVGDIHNGINGIDDVLNNDIGLDDSLANWSPFGTLDLSSLKPAFMAVSGFFTDIIDHAGLNTILRIAITCGFFATLVGIGVNIAKSSLRSDQRAAHRSAKSSDKGGGS